MVQVMTKWLRILLLSIGTVFIHCNTTMADIPSLRFLGNIVKVCVITEDSVEVVVRIGENDSPKIQSVFFLDNQGESDPEFIQDQVRSLQRGQRSIDGIVDLDKMKLNCGDFSKRILWYAKTGNISEPLGDKFENAIAQPPLEDVFQIKDISLESFHTRIYTIEYKLLPADLEDKILKKEALCGIITDNVQIIEPVYLSNNLH